MSSEPEPETVQEGVPPAASRAGAGDSAPHDQGRMGTCVVHAVVTVMAQRLMLKYGKVLDEADAISAIKRKAKAHAGSHVVKVLDVVRTLQGEDGLTTVGSEENLQLQVTHRGKVQNFGSLCSLMRQHPSEGAQAVAVIRTGAQGHDQHAVAAEGVGRAPGAGGGQSVRCKNSWGSSSPYFDVTSAGGNAEHEAPYVYHVHLADVTILKVWKYAGGRLAGESAPPVLPRYTALLDGNRAAANEVDLRRQRSAQLKRDTEREKQRRIQAECETAEHKAQLLALQAKLDALQKGGGGQQQECTSLTVGAIKITGAGVERVNGFYKQFGVRNDAPHYFKVGLDGKKLEGAREEKCTIYRRDGDRLWKIGAFSGDDIYYNRARSEAVPAFGWTVWKKGVAPPPTLTLLTDN